MKFLSKAVVLLALSATFPALAKAPVVIRIDKESGCWTSISKDSDFRITVKKPGTYLFLVMRGADSGENEADSKNWLHREPVIWNEAEPPNAPPFEFSEYDDRWTFTHLTRPGTYRLTFTPTAMQGWKGETSVCLRTSGKL